MRLKAPGNWAVPLRRRDHSSICDDDVVGGCAVLGTVTDSRDGVRF